VSRPHSIALLSIVFTTVYALAYMVSVWKNYALFTYHPVPGTLAFGVEKPQDGPAMYWFGWMATAALAAGAASLVAWLVPERLAARVASAWAWAIPLGVLIFFAYLLRGYFLR
jgi:hypothetical protein